MSMNANLKLYIFLLINQIHQYNLVCGKLRIAFTLQFCMHPYEITCSFILILTISNQLFI